MQANANMSSKLRHVKGVSKTKAGVAMLGHELRNPLAPIVTALQLMAQEGEHRASKEQQVIERQVRHMMRLVDDLLDVSRITRGKITLKKQFLDIRDLVADAIEVASPILEQNNHHFSVDVPQREIVVEADDTRLTQVFANLLVNAAKYTQPGGHIVVSVRRDGDEVIVEVRDDGVGIDPQLLPNVFDLFFQGQQGAERLGGGLGIGLTLVRTFVDMHGGKVQAHSAGTGLGSTFTVRLPIRNTPSIDTMSPAMPPASRHTDKLRRILIVDDNEDAVMLLAKAFSTIGHEVKTACDAPTALELVQDFKPDVAILDIGLPVMDGYTLASQLRAKLGPATCGG